MALVGPGAALTVAPTGRSIDRSVEESRRRAAAGHFDVGIVNSAPLGVLSGQRCITDFWRV
jgi:hypothetical protein